MYSEIMTASGFNNPWYWLLVAVVWVRSIQWTLGIPHDTIRAGKWGDEQARKDALALLDIHIRTIIGEYRQFGIYLVAVTCFVLASFATMGFWNDIAVLQGVFFIAFPMAILGGMSVSLAFKLHDRTVGWDELCSVYRKQRWIKIGLAILFILVSMIWAMFLEIRPFLDQL